MKVLLVGMDGAHIDVFKRGWTPYISSLIEKGCQLNIVNDLISRGWLEITTGQHASRTGAMYDRPKINGSYDWSFEFSIRGIPGFSQSIKPIWQVLNEHGYKTGIMNLPTAFPAPKVDGFFVSGGGGGAPVVEAPIPELCFPKEICSILKKNNYIVDERVVQLVVNKKLDTPQLIFRELAKKNKKRTSSFIELSKKYEIDFGFLVYKTSSVIAETILVPEWKKMTNKQEGVDEDVINALKEYYIKFDNEIRRLHKEFPEAEIVLVSDHGSTDRTHTVNLNKFLQLYGYQIIKTGSNYRKQLIEYMKKVIPFHIKDKLQKIKTLKKSVNNVKTFSSVGTVAFSYTRNDWSHGIYINDEARFGGPVLEENVENIKENIINDFNNDPEVRRHNLYAYSIKEKLSNPVDYFPDIVIRVPNGYLTNNSSTNFIEKYVRPQGVDSLSSVLRGDIISIKSHTPLAVYCADSEVDLKKLYDGRDLTAIYDLVLNKFNIENADLVCEK